MRNIKHFFSHPKDVLIGLLMRTAYFWPDKKYLQLLFRLKMGRELDLNNPQTFNEKLQWLKLYNRKAEYTTMVDKIEVKKWVAERIGEDYIIPTLGVWENAEDIDFNSLPNQFVLKTTHGGGGGGVIVCHDKSNLNIEATKLKLKSSLKTDIYIHYREWPYKNVRRKILAENFIFDINNPETPLNDYKFYCFNGKMTFMLISNERGNHTTKFDYFDRYFNHLPFTQGGENYNGVINKPTNFELMISLSEELSKGIPHVRVDLYEVNGKVYFGELTFFDASGFAAFNPEEWDYKFGSLITLPKEI